jgi:uncharacterized membrane protein YhaH (DUF805 family)
MVQALAAGLRPRPDPDSWRYIYGAWHGRVPRRTFWVHGVVILAGLGAIGHALLAIAGVDTRRAEWIVNAALLYPALAVSAKRWQDRGRSPAWVLVVLLPVIGWLWALVDNGLVRGTPGPNRWGPAPANRRLPGAATAARPAPDPHGAGRAAPGTPGTLSSGR